MDWWSAFAYARHIGKRLPSSLEWEAAARGADGRLFPWGDDIDLDAVHCADAYAGHALVTYEAWLAEHERGNLRHALPHAVDTHPRNRSPIGVRHMAGNVWELTSTTLGQDDMVVICGGGFDNPYRAVQASSKGLYRRHGSSNVVGFRCVEDPAVLVPYKGKNKPPSQKQANQAHANLRSPGERANAQLKSWKDPHQAPLLPPPRRPPRQGHQRPPKPRSLNSPMMEKAHSCGGLCELRRWAPRRCRHRLKAVVAGKWDLVHLALRLVG
ncbi:hypothetical protein FHU30_002874 [Actinomadura rupiterrae]|nr:hypothetical protein [Actinomadura rupiterrae]